MKGLNEATDSQLIQFYKQGQTLAFEVLLNRHKDKIFTSILCLIKDKHLAEDIFQEAFVKIINLIRNDNYQEQDKFLSWATRIARNLCLDHIRKIKRKPPVVNNEGEDIFEFLRFSEQNAETNMIRNQNITNMLILLDHLPDDQRETVVLRHFGELSFKEISELMNCSINTSLGRMRYGLLNLRKMMAKKHLSL